MGTEPHRTPWIGAAGERMANETGMEEAAPRWRRAAHGARGAMESNGVVGAVPPHGATPEPPLRGYQEPDKLSRKSCPWSCTEGCSEPGGIRTGCPFLPAPPCARDAPCHPKDIRLLPPLPKNGQPKGWAEPPKERPRWAEAVLGPLALFSHGYHRYPLPFPVEGEPHGAADGDPKTFRHCPFLLSSALPTEPPFGGTEGVTGTDWHLGSYMPTWGQPLFLGVPARGKAAPNPFSDCSGSGNRDFYPQKDPSSQPQDSAPPQLLEGRNEDGEGAPPRPPWRDGRAAPPPHALTPPPNAAPHPGAVRSCGAPWVGARPRSAHRPPPAPGEERPMGGGGPDPATAGRCPAVLPCPVGGCGPMGPFDTGGSDGETPAGGRGGVQKLKKTWLTRHSEQSGPRCRAARRDGTEEGFKRAGKRPSGHRDGTGTGAAKRGSNGTGRPGGTGMERGRGAPPEPCRLQSVPCTALPESIPRCCACAARGAGGEDEDGDPPESACRMLHFRRLAFGDGGTLSVDGFCTADEAEGEIWGAGGGTEGRSVCTAKYLLSVLGGPFCTAVLKDRDAWPGAQGGVAAWRCREGPPRLCDLCRRRFFNRHWSCARCGFQLCAECRRGRGEEDGHGDPAPQCNAGHQHSAATLIPTQLIPPRALSQLWQQLHEVCAKFSIASRCPCGDGGAEGTAEPQEKTEGADPPDPPAPDRELSSAAPIEDERREGGSPVPPPHPPRGAVQTATLCDLLASTAVRLCPGHPGVRMAFAPVASALHSDNRLTAILDSIIARVVERKIQERHGGTPRPSPPPGTPTSHRVLTPGGLLWLQDPPHATSYALFQQHWRQGQPVLVSGLQQRLDGGLWGPESFRPPGGGQQEVEVTELRAQKRVRMGSRRFWDGFVASAACPTLQPGAAELLKLECSFGDTQLRRTTDLSCTLPLPEYCAPHGRLNLASQLQNRRRLQPRICASYGIPPQDDAVGTKTLSVEPVDSISVAVHAAPGAPLQRDTEDVAEALTERLQAAGCRPAALWHVFRPEDASCIRDFLRGDAGGGAAPQPPAPYLHAELRRRLREERGVSCYAVLQCAGDAVLLPAGAPYQVRSLAATISVQQSFLSPESAARVADGAAAAHGEMQWLQGQVDGMVVAAVQQAVAVLRGCK